MSARKFQVKPFTTGKKENCWKATHGDHSTSAHDTEEIDVPSPANEDIILQESITEKAPSGQLNVTNEEIVPHNYLYQETALRVDTSNLLIRSYMCCHHLTRKAKEDLLQLLHIHLSKPNELSSSMYMFQTSNGSAVDFEPPIITQHRYCSDCDNICNITESSTCSRQKCQKAICFDTTPYFITVSIADQIKFFLKSMQYK